MKKIFYIIFNICSITSLPIYCQNNLDQATQSIFDKVAKFKEKIESDNNYQQTNLTLDQIEHILISQIAHKNSTLFESIAQRKSSHEKLHIIMQWLQDKKSREDWLDYFAIHNQMIIAIQKELESLQNCSEICNEIGQEFIDIFDLAIQDLYENNGKSEEMISLLYVRQDYINLFKINKKI